MSNEWLNELRRKMEDHTEDVPDGLWRNISEELFVEDETKSIPGPVPNDLKAQKTVMFNLPSLYRICGVAVAIAVFLILGGLFYFNGNKHQPEIKKQYTVKDSFQGKPISKPVGNYSGKDFGNQFFSVNQKEGKKENLTPEYLKKSLTKIHFLPGINQGERLKISSQNEVFTENKSAQKEDVKSIAAKPAFEETETYALTTKEERKQKEEAEKMKALAFAKTKSKWMLGLGTGNTSSNTTDQFPGYASLNGATPSLPEMWSLGSGEDPLMQILLANQDKKVDATIRHKTPVTIGASVYKNLGKKWSIGTGVNYTRLSAELTSGSPSDFISSEQNIHYVGIPVQVNYNVIQKGAFTGYVTGGGTVEKAVSGNIRTKYIVDGVIKQETKEDIGEKPVQVSVNSAVGVQFRLIKHIGIYAEPGIGYHFNDNSALKTIYKEKPLNFNLKFGVRILLD